jgi:hypothetical protein
MLAFEEDVRILKHEIRGIPNVLRIIH